jgi:hypothetical protein
VHRVTGLLQQGANRLQAQKRQVVRPVGMAGVDLGANGLFASTPSADKAAVPGACADSQACKQLRHGQSWAKRATRCRPDRG